MNHLPFFIASSARTGSHFYMSLLNGTGYICDVAEHLLLGYHISDDATLLEQFDKIGATCPSKAWGTKIDIRELPLVERYLLLKDIRISDIKWIWLRRRNKINQALSHLKAGDSGIHHIRVDDYNFAEKKNILENLDSEYSLDQINAFVMLFLLADHEWDMFFREHHLNPLTLFYEDFIEPSTWEDLVIRTFDFLDIAIEHPLELRTTHFRRSHGEVTTVHEEFFNQPLFYANLSAPYENWRCLS